MKTTDGRDAVLKLKRALYGTKQASRLWQQRLAGHLENKMGFYRSTTDPCLFSRRHSDGSVILLGVYVDDIIVAHNRKNFEWFTKEFTAGFNSKHLGKLTWFLGMGVDQNDDYSVTVNQTSYVKKLIEKFIPNHATSAINHNMPCNPTTFQKLRLAITQAEKDKASKLPYLQLIGSLLYLSCMTRPDIAYHMSVLCSFMHNPTLRQWSAITPLSTSCCTCIAPKT